MIANNRGDERLRRHRVSIPQTSYFLTICTIDRTPILLRSGVANCIRNEIRTIETTGHWHCRAGVIMPDHIHLLVRMTGVLPVGRCVARLKAKTNSWLHAADTRWQRNFYEHRLRPDDSVEEVLRYIFLNPHRE